MGCGGAHELLAAAGAQLYATSYPTNSKQAVSLDGQVH